MKSATLLTSEQDTQRDPRMGKDSQKIMQEKWKRIDDENRDQELGGQIHQDSCMHEIKRTSRRNSSNRS
jgi:hypothetical protein